MGDVELSVVYDNGNTLRRILKDTYIEIVMEDLENLTNSGSEGIIELGVRYIKGHE